MIRTIILERIEETGINIFKSFSNICEFYDKKEKDIFNKIQDFDVVVIKSTVKIDKEFLNKANKLKVIARAGTGLDNINTSETKLRGIKVFSVPRGNTVAAAEYVISLIFLLTKKLFLIHEMIKKNDLSRHKIILNQLDSMTIGIIGIGNLGIEISKRLERFGCGIVGFDPFSKKIEKFKKLGGKYISDLNKLLEKSDVLVLAASLDSNSQYLINNSNIKRLKKGAFFINCARAKLVDQNALIYALNKNIISLAAIDLIDPEPIYKKKKNINHPLINHPNVFYSPHVAALTDIAQKKISITLGKKVRHFFINKNKK